MSERTTYSTCGLGNGGERHWCTVCEERTTPLADAIIHASDCPVPELLALRERAERAERERDEALARGRAEGVAACVNAVRGKAYRCWDDSRNERLTHETRQLREAAAEGLRQDAERLADIIVDGTALARLLREAEERHYADGYQAGLANAESRDDAALREAAARALEDVAAELDKAIGISNDPKCWAAWLRDRAAAIRSGPKPGEGEQVSALRKENDG